MGFLPSVALHVGAEVVDLSEGGCAHMAREGTLPRMQQHVALQLAGSVEGRSALVTLVAFLVVHRLLPVGLRDVLGLRDGKQTLAGEMGNR